MENQDTTCMWFKRNLLGIEDDKQSKSSSRYIGKNTFIVLNIITM